MKQAGKIGCGLLLLGLAGILFGLFGTARGRRLTGAVSHLVETDELQGRRLETADDVLAYLKQHPTRYALAAWDVGDEDGGFFHDADHPWPLASTVKLLPLALASEKLSSGEWDPTTPTPEIESFYLPGTDGNAHPDALRELDGGTSTLGNAVSAMIVYSDNAATDAILFRLGRPALEQGAARFGVNPPHPLTGDFWLAQQGFDGGSIDDAAWALAELHSKQPSPDLLETALPDQEAMARALDNQGSARASARLIERLCANEEPAYQPARQRLAWPMKFESNRRDFKSLQTKGGSLPGVLTSATFAELKTGRRRVVALFLHDLPFATWLSLSSSYAQQKLERRILLDDDGISKLRSQLAQ